jgi:hypothetical protein
MQVLLNNGKKRSDNGPWNVTLSRAYKNRERRALLFLGSQPPPHSRRHRRPLARIGFIFACVNFAKVECNVRNLRYKRRNTSVHDNNTQTHSNNNGAGTSANAVQGATVKTRDGVRTNRCWDWRSNSSHSHSDSNSFHLHCCNDMRLPVPSIPLVCSNDCLHCSFRIVNPTPSHRTNRNSEYERSENDHCCCCYVCSWWTEDERGTSAMRRTADGCGICSEARQERRTPQRRGGWEGRTAAVRGMLDSLCDVRCLSSSQCIACLLRFCGSEGRRCARPFPLPSSAQLSRSCRRPLNHSRTERTAPRWHPSRLRSVSARTVIAR